MERYPRITINEIDDSLEYRMEKEGIHPNMINSFAKADFLLIPKFFDGKVCFSDYVIQFFEFTKKIHNISIEPFCKDRKFLLLREQPTDENNRFTLDLIVNSENSFRLLIDAIRTYFQKKKWEKIYIILSLIVFYRYNSSIRIKKIEFEGFAESLDELFELVKSDE